MEDMFHAPVSIIIREVLDFQIDRNGIKSSGNAKGLRIGWFDSVETGDIMKTVPACGREKNGKGSHDIT